MNSKESILTSFLTVSQNLSFALKSRTLIVLGEVPRVSPTSSPILPLSKKKPELVLFVGHPASGKSTFFETTFRPAGYAHVNQDTLGSRPKCIKAAEQHLKSGESCVIGTVASPSSNAHAHKYTQIILIKTRKRVNFIFS